MEKRIKYGTLLLISLIIGLALYGYFFHIARPDPLTIRHAELQVAAAELTALAENNESRFDQQYLNKIVSVRGIVRRIENIGAGCIIFLAPDSRQTEWISCRMDDTYPLTTRPGPGDSCTIRGTCAGHLKDVVLLSCIIEKH